MVEASRFSIYTYISTGSSKKEEHLINTGVFRLLKKLICQAQKQKRGRQAQTQRSRSFGRRLSSFFVKASALEDLKAECIISGNFPARLLVVDLDKIITVSSLFCAIAHCDESETLFFLRIADRPKHWVNIDCNT